MKDAAAAVAAPIWRIMRGQNYLAVPVAVMLALVAGVLIESVTVRADLAEAQAELTRVRFDTWVETVDMLERSGWGPLPIGDTITGSGYYGEHLYGYQPITDTIRVRYFRGIGDPYNTMMDSSAYMVQTDSYYWHCEGTENGAGTTCSDGVWVLRER